MSASSVMGLSYSYQQIKKVAQLALSPSMSDSPGSHKAPQNWKELKTALLDCLLPANSVEESALRLSTFSMDRGESVASFALRFQ